MVQLRIGDEVCKRLSQAYELDVENFIAPRLRGVPLFEFIVAVVLSQNTSDKNAWRAYENLKSKLGSITPEGILETGVKELAELIRVAGMQFERARKIRRLAEIFSSENVEKRVEEAISRGDHGSAREKLLSLPGVGLKTADVVFLMYYGIPVFPVDTHITRITKRLGFVESSNYERIKSFWMENTTPSNYLQLHLLLIEHGRRTCKARRPLCEKCNVIDLCKLGKELFGKSPV